MIGLTLKQLRYFDALARQGHFGRAASMCAISQPALSAQIKELEHTLGAALFERGPRSLRLTRFGATLLPKAREVLAATDSLGELAKAHSGQGLGRFRLGVIPTIAPYLLPTLVPKLQADHPELDLNIRETLTSGLVSELGEGRLDAAIVALPVSEPSFTEAALFNEDFVLVRPAADAAAPVPDGEALQKMRLLLLEEGHCFRDQALSFCKMQTATPREGLDGSSLTTLVQMVGAGLGVTLIPEMSVMVETRSTPVSIAKFPEPAPKRQIGMIWRKSNPLSEQLWTICDTVRAAGQDCRIAGAS